MSCESWVNSACSSVSKVQNEFKVFSPRFRCDGAGDGPSGLQQMVICKTSDISPMSDHGCASCPDDLDLPADFGVSGFSSSFASSLPVACFPSAPLAVSCSAVSTDANSRMSSANGPWLASVL